MSLRSSLLAALLAVPLAVGAQTATDVTLEAPDGSTVAIDRDDFGVPHITGDTEAAVFFGQGFATGQDRLFQLETFWRTATGRLAELRARPRWPRIRASARSTTRPPRGPPSSTPCRPGSRR